jgi:hypothetical protein
MKIATSLTLMAVVCVAVLSMFMSIRPAPAQDAWKMNDYGRPHGYLTWPRFCGIQLNCKEPSQAPSKVRSMKRNKAHG